MQLLHSRNPWSYRYGPDPIIDFCFWILQVDGLQVPPFDQHSDGDGSLRTLGLTIPDWQAWFLRAINPQQSAQDIEQLQQQAFAVSLKLSGEPDLEHFKQRYQSEHLKISKAPPLPALPEFYHYHASWRGSIAIKNRLIEMQEPYKQVYSQHDQLCSDISMALSKEEDRSNIRLYDELKPYHTRIPPLVIHFVVYKEPLDYLIPPATLIMTVQEGQPSPQEFRERVLLAVAEFASRPGKFRKQSLYTKMGEIIGQPTTSYRRHVRKLVLPPPPEQEIPTITDPARQAVLEYLSNRLFYGSVDFTTVQFLREKKRPGWILYEGTFQETDGEQHREIFVLQQNEDGSWNCNGAGSSADMQNQWFNIIIPVHDHPLIFLSVGWTKFDNHQLLLLAHGHVIDNGFHVEQVHLVNKVGQILEDTVEDGYVFFACKPEQQMQLPMQAKLYDHHGNLVWQQKVPDTGLPPWETLRQL